MANKPVPSSVVTYALWRTRSEADAEDLVGEAILYASDHQPRGALCPCLCVDEHDALAFGACAASFSD